MKNISIILPCSQKHPDRSMRLFETDTLNVHLIYCKLSSLYSRILLRIKYFSLLHRSAVLCRTNSFGKNIFYESGRELVKHHINELAALLTDGDFSRLVLYIDNTAQLRHCHSLFYNIGSFSVFTSSNYAERLDSYIVEHYGAAGIVKTRLPDKGMSVISLADSVPMNINGSDFIVCLGKADIPGAVSLSDIYFTPPGPLSFLPPPLCSATELETLIKLCDISYGGEHLKYVKTTK